MACLNDSKLKISQGQCYTRSEDIELKFSTMPKKT